jgi:hypothetical protein
LDLLHYRDKGEKLGQPFNKEQGVSNNSSNSTQAEKRSLNSALSHGPHPGHKMCRVHPQVPRSTPLRLAEGKPWMLRKYHFSRIKDLHAVFIFLN